MQGREDHESAPPQRKGTIAYELGIAASPLLVIEFH